MASHFSSIGLPVESDEEFLALLARVEDSGVQMDARGNSYFRWQSGVGAELWVQLDRAGDLMGVQPHFSGKARMLVKLTVPISRETDSPLDGAWHAWAEPDGQGTGTYPFVFDTPDFHLHAPDLTRDVEVQIAAFAHEMTVYSSVSEYERATAEEEPRFATESFIPAGLFSPDGGASWETNWFMQFTRAGA